MSKKKVRKKKEVKYINTIITALAGILSLSLIMPLKYLKVNQESFWAVIIVGLVVFVSIAGLFLVYESRKRFKIDSKIAVDGALAVLSINFITSLYYVFFKVKVYVPIMISLMIVAISFIREKYYIKTKQSVYDEAPAFDFAISVLMGLIPMPILFPFMSIDLLFQTKEDDKLLLLMINMILTILAAALILIKLPIRTIIKALLVIAFTPFNKKAFEEFKKEKEVL